MIAPIEVLKADVENIQVEESKVAYYIYHTYSWRIFVVVVNMDVDFGKDGLQNKGW